MRLLPKVLVDVSKVDTGIELFGKPAALPLAIAPTGGISAGRAGAELILARAAKAAGVPFTMATPSAFSIERVAEEVGGRLWFQLYCVRDMEFRNKLVARAKDAGYEAILVTVDLPVSGKRERDPRNGFHTPYKPNWRNSRDVMFKLGLAARDTCATACPGMANLEGYPFSAPAGVDIVTAVGREMDAGLDWEYIKQLREQWPGKLLLKGVERPDDAERAVSVGCDGVVVSNHGGRQLDGAAATLDALPAIASAVGNKITVLLDGGVRRGVDILKARALGAQAVLDRARDALRRDGRRRAGRAPRARDPVDRAGARDAAVRRALDRGDRRRPASGSARAWRLAGRGSRRSGTPGCRCWRTRAGADGRDHLGEFLGGDPLPARADHAGRGPRAGHVPAFAGRGGVPAGPLPRMDQMKIQHDAAVDGALAKMQMRLQHWRLQAGISPL